MLLGLKPSGTGIARHIKGKKIRRLEKDAERVSKKSQEDIRKIIEDTILALGNTLSGKETSLQNQAYLISFVADLEGGASTHQLHYLIHDYHVGTDAIVDAFHTALGLGNRKRAINLVKAFPELIFEKVADDKSVYEHFTEDHWMELLKGDVINFQFFKTLSDKQVVKIFRMLPIYKPLLRDKSLLRMIINREEVRNKLLNYFDELVKVENTKADFIMKLASMPLTSRDSKGNIRIMNYYKKFSQGDDILSQLKSLKDFGSSDFIAELLSVVEIPKTLESYQLHLLIGKLLSTVDGLRHQILDQIEDPEKRHLRYELLEYCKELYENKECK